MSKDNIVLVGFMGTGKSTVGQLLAKRLGWDFIDSDAEVVRMERATIAEIFAVRGEQSFREAESAAIQHILSGTKQVLSTGGGSVLAEKNRELMLERGYVVALRASVDAILMRVGNAEDRPLLKGNAREQVLALMEKRSLAYDFAQYQCITDGLTPEEVVEQILIHIHS